jgi:hypothetical protein
MTRSPVVFLVGDGRIQDDVRHIGRAFVPKCRDRFWLIHEGLSQQLDYRNLN